MTSKMRIRVRSGQRSTSDVDEAPIVTFSQQSGKEKVDDSSLAAGTEHHNTPISAPRRSVRPKISSPKSGETTVAQLRQRFEAMTDQIDGETGRVPSPNQRHRRGTPMAPAVFLDQANVGGSPVIVDTRQSSVFSFGQGGEPTATIPPTILKELSPSDCLGILRPTVHTGDHSFSSNPSYGVSPGFQLSLIEQDAGEPPVEVQGSSAGLEDGVHVIDFEYSARKHMSINSGSSELPDSDGSSLPTMEGRSRPNSQDEVCAISVAQDSSTGSKSSIRCSRLDNGALDSIMENVETVNIPDSTSEILGAPEDGIRVIDFAYVHAVANQKSSSTSQTQRVRSASGSGQAPSVHRRSGSKVSQVSTATSGDFMYPGSGKPRPHATQVNCQVEKPADHHEASEGPLMLLPSSA